MANFNRKRMIVQPWGGHTKTSEVAKEKQAFLRTTDATPATIFSQEIPLNTVVHVTAEVAVVDEAGVESAIYYVAGKAVRAAGALTVTSIDVYKSESDAALDCVWDASSPNLRLRATGKAATNLRWRAAIRLIGVQ